MKKEFMKALKPNNLAFIRPPVHYFTERLIEWGSVQVASKYQSSFLSKQVWRLPPPLPWWEGG